LLLQPDAAHFAQPLFGGLDAPGHQGQNPSEQFRSQLRIGAKSGGKKFAV
jgi:hypothetical protein